MTQRRFPDSIRTLAFLDFPADAAIEKLRQYEGAAIDAFITANSTKPFMLGWYGGSRRDYREYAGELRKLIRRQPGIRLFIQVGSLSGAAPLRWGQEHRDQLAKHADGTVLTAPSLASFVWRDESSDAIRALVEHFESSDLAENIAGYIPVCNGLEWRGIGESPSELPAREMDVRNSRGDFSGPMIDGFREWLRGRYGDDAAKLQAAWRTPDVGFDTALPPGIPERDHADHGAVFLPDGKWGSRFSDYFSYYHTLHAELALAWCRAVKDGCAWKKPVGLCCAFPYGGINASSHPQGSGQAFAARLLAADEVDFFGAPFGYTNRSIRGAHISCQATDSVAARGKVFVDIVESGTHLRRITHREIAMMAEGGHHVERSGLERWDAIDAWETEQLLKRDAALALTKPSTRIAWLEKRCPAHGHWFTHHQWGPFAYDSPEVRARIAELNRILSEGRSSTSSAEVAVFSSSEGALHRAMERKFGNFFVEGFRHFVLPELGLPFDDYLLEDWALAHRGGRTYKAYIFLDALFVPSALRRDIRSRIEESGATAIWFYAPGYLDETGPDLHHCESLTGIRLGRTEGPQFLHIAGPDVFGSHVDPAKFGQRMPEGSWPQDGRFSPVFHSSDPGAEVLGLLDAPELPGLVAKSLGKGRSIYCAAPLPPPGLVRGWLEASGAHLYSTTGDVIHASKEHLCIICRNDGETVVSLPANRTAMEILGGNAVIAGSCIRIQARAGETRIFRLKETGR